MTTQGGKRNVLGWFFVGFALLCVVGFLFQWVRPSPPIRVSPQTTFLTAPLKPDGLPDYKLARMLRQGRGVVPEENAAVPFWQAMGRSGWKPAQWAELGRELGFQPPAGDEGLSQQYKEIIVVIRDWLAAEHPTANQHGPYGMTEGLEDQIAERCQSEPWSTAECPPLAELINSYEPYYDLLHEAAQRSVFYSPEVLDESSVGFSRGLTSSLREMIRALGRRASLRIGEGDLEGAWADMRTALVLGALPHCDDMTDLLVEIACEGVVHHQLRYLLADERVTSVIVNDVLRTLDQLPDLMNRLKGVLVGDRLQGIQFVLENHKNPSENFTVYDWQEFQSSGLVRGSVNWNVTLEKTNLAYDRLTAILSIADRKIRGDQLQAWSDQFVEDLQHISSRWIRAVGYIDPGKRSRIIADEIVGNSMLGSYKSLHIIAEESVVRRELTKVAAKVTSFRLKSGSNPESLTRLVPEVFSAQPLDGVYGSAIEYRPLPDNGMLLYSLGPDGQDDGGSRASHYIYRGIHLSDWGFRSRETDADRVKQYLQEAGESSFPADLLDPYSWITADADDISWRTPLPVEPLQEFLERITFEAEFGEDKYGGLESGEPEFGEDDEPLSE